MRKYPKVAYVSGVKYDLHFEPSSEFNGAIAVIDHPGVSVGDVKVMGLDARNDRIGYNNGRITIACQYRG